MSLAKDFKRLKNMFLFVPKEPGMIWSIFGPHIFFNLELTFLLPFFPSNEIKGIKLSMTPRIINIDSVSRTF